MNHKKELDVKSVHRFTENANMKFRPTFYKTPHEITHSNSSVVSKVSSIFGNFFANSFKPNPKIATNPSQNKTYTKSAIVEGSPSKNKSLVQSRSKISEPASNGESPLRID
jgi:hypothetical protein